MSSVTAPAPDRFLPSEGQGPANRIRTGPEWQRSFVWVLLGTVAGLVLVSAGDVLGRVGHQNWAMDFYLIGVVVVYWACARRLLAEDAIRSERIAVSCVLGAALSIAYFMLSPLMFVGFDELLHEISLWQWGMHRGTIAQNTLMPISPYYPGLEALTLGIRWLTGLPLVVCEMATVLLSRIVLMLAIFLVVERLTRSSLAAGAGVVVYGASPQFYSFNSAFSYQTLAIAFAAGCVYLTLRAVDNEGPSQKSSSWVARHSSWIAVACCWAAVVTHHLVGWLTVGLLVVWALAAAVVRRRDQARAVGGIAGAGLVGAIAWTAFTGRELFAYLSPILGPAASGIVGLVDGSGRRRALFHGTSGVAEPRWEQAVMLVAALIIVGLLVVSTRALMSRSSILRGGLLRWLPLVVALSYFVVLGSRLSPNSAETGGRLSTFAFFGIAVVVGAWFAMARGRALKKSAAAVASLCFLGGLLLGAGPQWQNVPGPYMPAADGRSIDAPSVAAAQWAANNLPVGSVVAADRDNGALMAAIGHLTAESEAAKGGTNVGPLYFARTWGPYYTSLVRREHIRYLVVDQRLASGPPAFGLYFQPGETHGRDRLTLEELRKFSAIPGMQLIYDNGPIQIYDLAGMLGLSPRQASKGAPAGGWPFGLDWWLVIPAAGVLVIWVRRWRVGTAEGLLVQLLVASMVLMAAAVVIFLVPLPATPIGLAFLVVLGGWGLMGLRTRVPRRERPRRSVRHAAAIVAAAALVAVPITVSATAEAVAWGEQPASLALNNDGSGAGIVAVHLPKAGENAHLELRRGGVVVWRTVVPTGRTSWTVRLPRGPAANADSVVLLEGGRVAREVRTRPIASGVLAARVVESSLTSPPNPERG